jgi:hypothetical protein
MNSKYYSLEGCTDNDFIGNIDYRKNKSDYSFHLGTNLISWASKKQPIATIHLAEEEYLAVTSI